MYPNRVLSNTFGTFYGYGDSSKKIETVTSCHERGNEPTVGVVTELFGRLWELYEVSHMYGGVVYAKWRRYETT